MSHSQINYGHFINIVKKIAAKYITRGRRKEYVPRWTKECEQLLQLYRTTNIDNRIEWQSCYTVILLNLSREHKNAGVHEESRKEISSYIICKIFIPLKLIETSKL